MIRYEKDTQQIATLTLEMDGSQYNTLQHDISKSFGKLLNHLKGEKEKGALKGVIITSAKRNFLTGGDLDFYHQCTNAEAAFQASQQLCAFFRGLEAPGVAVVAALNGTALGSGFGLALACHYRVALDKNEIKLGFPETSLGLMSSGGEIIRLMWLMGIEKAFQVATAGRFYTPKEALKIGLIDELATDERDLLEKARQWLLNQSETYHQIWDTKTGVIPEGSARDSKVGETIRRLTAEHYKKNYLNYPALTAILSTLVEGSRVDFDTACRIQSRYFTQVLLTKEAKSMTKAFGYDLQSVRKGCNRPKGYGKFRPKKIGIIGAGLMGSGITYICANEGLKVVLKDISRSVAEKGKSYSENKLKERVKLGEITDKDAQNILSRITATEKMSDFQDCDLVIEAVFENRLLKSKIIRDAEMIVDKYCMVASNTSSIPITELAKTAYRPQNFCGMRFFRPVDGEFLVEIVKGAHTADETIARAFDFIKMIHKIPIIVKDSWGFYVGRVRNTYILEGIALLQEGYSPALIENLGIQAGMQTGPLALADDLSLAMVAEYEQQAAQLYGPKYVRHPAGANLDLMIADKRTGKHARMGFYDYDNQGHMTKLWHGMDAPQYRKDFDRAELTERLLFAQALEAIWCLQEKIVGSAAEANLGSIYGWKFPASKGGVLQYVNDYGLFEFSEKCKVYRALHGQRFKVPTLLKTMLEKNEKF
jgi:3-hydroxyacyl-CoA dehydrogenase / enoyl-CoA hydratase / 3-hydroxybutyryl-CoA epimerase